MSNKQIFPGPWINARGARPWWPPESKGRSLTPNANGMTEATGVKTEFWRHVGHWDTVGDQLVLYDSNRNKSGLCKILCTEAQLPKQTWTSCFLWDLWVSHLWHLHLHSHLPGGADTDFLLQTSRRSFICSKKETRTDLETRPVYKINIISFWRFPISNKCCGQGGTVQENLNFLEVHFLKCCFLIAP